jgi:3'(2'), 5'-bisphosphate nucleotidase
MPHVKPLPPLAQIAKNAGDEVARMQDGIVAAYDHGNGVQSEIWHKKPDDSIVTAADLKANEMVCTALAELKRSNRKYRNIAVVSEENPEADNAKALQEDDRVETDPLDNTSGYVEGLKGYSVNIGRIKNGVPVEGAIYFPALKELYFTDGKKAYLQVDNGPWQPLKAARAVRNPLKVAVGFHEQNVGYLERDTKGEKRELERMPLPAQMRTCQVAAGKCDISGVNKGTGGFNTWDIAGPHAVLLRAGGDIVEENGKPFRYGHDSVKVPNHIVGSKAALALCVQGYVPERGDILKS